MVSKNGIERDERQSTPLVRSAKPSDAELMQSVLPEVLPHGAKDIAKGCLLLGVPRGLPDRKRGRVQPSCLDHDQAEHAKQAGRGSTNGSVAPAALRLKAEARPHLLS